MKILVLILLIVSTLNVITNQPKLPLVDNRVKAEESVNALVNTIRHSKSTNEIEIPNTSSPSKKKKVKKPVVIEFNSEYNLMVYSEDFEGTYTWHQGIKACEKFVAFGYDDWYLPSQKELDAVYKKKKEIGNFFKTSYWCSSEPFKAGSNSAKFQHFYNGGTSYFPKNSKRKVRCVRKVSLK